VLSSTLPKSRQENIMREARVRSRRNFYRQIIKSLLALLLFAAALLGYGLYIEPNWFEVKEISLNLPHLSPAFDGYKIVQISDIHADRYFRISNLDTVAQKINDQHPDLVVLTGDYVSKGRVPEAVGAIAKSFRQIEAKDGILAVLGNHDYWAKAKDVTRELTRYQIKLLKNQLVAINRGSEQLSIGGVDDVWAGKPDLKAVLKDLGSKQGAILLAHEPDFADIAAASHQFDLELSGHSHGAQVRVPFSDVVLPYLGRKYPHGQYQVLDMIQYTNRGIGLGGIPVRFNCRPEITSFVLHGVP
jgi:uncharacterized protein